jgi:hypothetical protein
MPKYKGPRIEQIAVGVGVCAAVCGTAYCLHKYLLARPRDMLLEMDIDHQAVDLPVGILQHFTVFSSANYLPHICYLW